MVSRQRQVSLFRNSHPDIIFTPADKGSVTVAVDKFTYLEKVNGMLGDVSTYLEIKRNSVSNIEKRLNELLRLWVKKEYITDLTYNTIKSSDGCLPKAYGIPKIHKKDHPFRLIVSSINSPLHCFAEYLHKLILKSIPKADSHIENSLNLLVNQKI